MYFELFIWTVFVTIAIMAFFNPKNINKKIYKAKYSFLKLKNYTSSLLTFTDIFNSSKNYKIILIPGNPGITHFYDDFLFNLNE